MKYETVKNYNETKFKRLVGIKKKTFDRMIEKLRPIYEEKMSKVEENLNYH